MHSPDMSEDCVNLSIEERSAYAKRKAGLYSLIPIIQASKLLRLFADPANMGASFSKLDMQHSKVTDSSAHVGDNFGWPRCSRACTPRRLLERKYREFITSIQKEFKFSERQRNKGWIWMGHIFTCNTGLGRGIRGQYAELRLELLRKLVMCTITRGMLKSVECGVV